jgi:hypothetical protein
MPEVQRYRDAVRWVFDKIDEDMASIVSASIVSAIDGKYGDYHMTRRTEGSKLWINPLMIFYWTFDLDAVAQRVLYLDHIRETESWEDLRFAIQKFRASVDVRGWEEISV